MGKVYKGVVRRSWFVFSEIEGEKERFLGYFSVFKFELFEKFFKQHCDAGKPLEVIAYDFFDWPMNDGFLDLFGEKTFIYLDCEV